MVAIGFIAVTDTIGGGAGFVNNANGADNGFNSVSDSDGFVFVKSLIVDVIITICRCWWKR